MSDVDMAPFATNVQAGPPTPPPTNAQAGPSGLKRKQSKDKSTPDPHTQRQRKYKMLPSNYHLKRKEVPKDAEKTKLAYQLHIHALWGLPAQDSIPPKVTNALKEPFLKTVTSLGLRSWALDVLSGDPDSMYNLLHKHVAFTTFEKVAAAHGYAHMGVNLSLVCNFVLMQKFYHNFVFSYMYEIAKLEAKSPGSVARFWVVLTVPFSESVSLWTNTLSEMLVPAISKSMEIKQGLYPLPRCKFIDSKGGWAEENCLAVETGSLNPPQKQTASKAQAPWVDKIKNRLKTTTISRMSTIVRGHMETLGKTGEAEVNANCPWFFEMCNIIAERPNLVPTSISHSSSSINMSVLQSVNEDDKVADGDRDGDFTSKAELKDKEDSGKNLGGMLKNKSRSVATNARPGSSKPAVVKSKVKNSHIEEFSLTAQAEEATKQKEINLNKAKVESVALIKVKNKRAESAKTKEKYSLRQEKCGMEKEIKIERMRLKQA
ncbi:hypothetical protein B0H34DRAFT_675962 [Crassisporium funariophilum]|nr:hypothetical protein B0H34DRAFT_675962 [Crassisporium funariophilum]